jgi:hypothetical protein
MINKLRIVEKEKEQLEGKKLEAEAYMAKQAECTIQRLMGHKINGFKAQVRAAGAGAAGAGLTWPGLPEALLQQQAPAAGLHARGHGTARSCCAAPPTVALARLPPAAQAMIQEMDGKMAEVAGKLQHEREKFKRFDEELKEHDQKHQVGRRPQAARPPAGLVPRAGPLRSAAQAA